MIVVLLLAAPAAAAPTTGEDRVHVVASGETLYDIAFRYGLGLEHVSWANGLPMKNDLEAGTRLVIPTRRVLPANPPHNGMVLNVPERGVYLFLNGRFHRFYPVAVGRTDFPTPRGSFRVISKIKDPTWYPPAWAGLKETAIPPGPRNPLGDRWIGLSATRVGLHGTQSPLSIGDAISHGCLRMYPEHVRELFELVWVGMPIRIEYETAKLGRDEQGRLYLAAWPDLYGVRPTAARVERLLSSIGRPNDASLISREKGRAIALDGAAPDEVAPADPAEPELEPEVSP